MTTTDATSARVELLTAEVRTLMVGNRQVTLSVAKQLDRVELEEVEPFGRIRMGDEPLVIGRSIATGALVVAHYREYRASYFRAVIFPDDLGEKRITVCSRARPNSEGFFRLTFAGASIEVDDDVVQMCDKDHQPLGDDRCGFWSTNGADEEIAARVKQADDRWQRHVAAGRLPLIVLAGLR